VQPTLKLLVPINLDRDAEAAVQHAIDVATSMRGDLTLLYVIDPSRTRGGRRVEWPRNAMADYPECYIRTVTLSGPVADTVGRYAADIDADLLILASRHGGWKRSWTDSVAAGILASTSRPVCVTSTKAIANSRPFRCRRIVCVVALDRTDGPVVRYAEALTNRCRGELLLLHVLPEPAEALFMYLAAEIEHRRILEGSAAQRIGELAAGISCSHSASIAAGSACASISRAVRNYGADLIVAGKPSLQSSHDSGLDLGTLLSRLSCPVLSVPTASAAFELALEGAPARCLANA
jgi:nucleotide-binding universal stress UspA family protein